MGAKGKLTGWHVLMMLVAFFGVMIVANVAFISAAVKTFPGVTDEHAYDKGLKYNETLAARAEQAALGWTAEVTEVTRIDGAGRIVVRIVDGDRALSRLAVSGALRRPASAEGDQPLAFAPLGDGLYEANVADFAPGAWDMTARAEDGAGEAFDFTARIIAQ